MSGLRRDRLVTLIGLLGLLGSVGGLPASEPVEGVEPYPVLPPAWQYLGYVYDPSYDGGKTQSNFFLDRREVYPACPGLELVHAGHHGGTHVVVQYRDDQGAWHWRPALYPDRDSMPEYPPVCDAFSGCYFVTDPELDGGYFVAYQRSDPEGTHAVFHMVPRRVQGPAEQPYDGHALLTMRVEPGGPPGDPICKGGIWGLPVPFSMGARRCLLVLSSGHLNDELPGGVWSVYPVMFRRDPNDRWADVPTNSYQHLLIESQDRWAPLRWNPLELLGAVPQPGTTPGVQAQAAVFEVASSTYLLVAGGATMESGDWAANPTSRGFVLLYRFLPSPPTVPDAGCRVELVQAVVDPKQAMPGSAAMVGGFIPGAIRPLPIRLSKEPSEVPSFVCGMARRGADDPERWQYDFGAGPKKVPGGFVVLRGSLDPNTRPAFEVIPPTPYPLDDPCDLFSGYGLCLMPGLDGDDVIAKVHVTHGFQVLRVPNKGGRFDMADAQVLLDSSWIAPTERWAPYFFSACFLGLFPSEDTLGGYDLVVPFSLEERLLEPGQEEPAVHHTYIRCPMDQNL